MSFLNPVTESRATTGRLATLYPLEQSAKVLVCSHGPLLHQKIFQLRCKNKPEHSAIALAGSKYTPENSAKCLPSSRNKLEESAIALVGSKNKLEDSAIVLPDDKYKPQRSAIGLTRYVYKPENSAKPVAGKEYKPLRSAIEVPRNDYKPEDSAIAVCFIENRQILAVSTVFHRARPQYSCTPTLHYSASPASFPHRPCRLCNPAANFSR